MKSVLILLATYNGEKYLEMQLNSIFSQKNVDVEVLVRDDGSTDNTISILKKWESTHNLKWYTGERLNAQFSFYDLMTKAVNRNFDYYALSDQDDYWLENKLSCAIDKLEELEENKSLLYYSGQIIVDENLKYLHIHNLNKKRNMVSKFIFSDIAGCTAVFNKRLLNTIVKFKPNYMLMHDSWILKVCLATGGLVYDDENAYIKYRQHGNNAVGLKNDFMSKIKRGGTYIFDYNLHKQIKELNEGYRENFKTEYKELVDDILNYKHRKRTMLKKKYVDFHDIGLNVIYRIKLIFNKM